MANPESRPSRFPDTLVLIFSLVVLAQLLTYVLPSGAYRREPNPDAGKPFADAEGATPLRERLADARRERGLAEEQVATIFHVSPTTVRRWELGPAAKGAGPHGLAGTHIEAGAGALLLAWIATGEPPSGAAIDAWKASIPGKQRLVPDSYAATPTQDKPWLPAWHAITAIPRGLAEAADIIFFVFLIGGVIGVMRATGAFDALIGTAIHAFGNNAFPLVAGTVTLFAIGSGLIGMAEEYVPFITLLVTMSLAMRLDAMVGISIVFVGYAVGYGCAPINPFTVLVAQGIADLPPTSGWWYRALLLALCLVVGVHHVLAYARRIAKDPSRSLVADLDHSTGFDLPEDVRLTPRRTLVLLGFAAAVGTFVYGVARYEWGFGELSAVFLGLGILTPIVAGVSPNRAAQEFCKGAAELTTTALLIGFARTIEVVLLDGQVIDTVVHGIAGSLEGLGTSVGVLGMLVVQTLTNFFIPSGSGQAYVTMPIMAPLADQLGIERQVAVLAYQFGDGFTNVVTPTNAAFMGMLAMARVPYQRWLRFALPLMLKLYTIAAISLVVAVHIGYR